MDAPYYNGADDREFGIDPDDEHCPDCGASADEPCEKDCGCRACREKDEQHPISRVTGTPARGAA